MKPTQSIFGIGDRVTHWSVAFLMLIFVAFLFVMSRIWLVTASSVKVAEELEKQLPETTSAAAPRVPLDPMNASASNEEDYPDEVILSMSETGAPSINDEPVSDLSLALGQLLKNAGKRKVIVTVLAHEKTPYGEITRTLDILGTAGIVNVTFSVGSEEGF